MCIQEGEQSHRKTMNKSIKIIFYQIVISKYKRVYTYFYPH